MDILDLVGQHAPLKGMMIDFILKNMKEQFFERRVYQAYNCAPYNERLCQDYESNDMNVKIFSLKVLCFLISDAQSEYVPFLKKCYSQLHDRLSSLQRSDSEEKSICLRLIR